MKLAIGYKNKYGKYKTVVKEFNDDKHYNNWVTAMEKYGTKIIGKEEIL